MGALSTTSKGCLFSVPLRIVLSTVLLLTIACSGPSDKKKDPVLIAESNRLASHGSYWYNRGCYTKAERYFFQAMETARLLDDTKGIMQARNNLGATAIALGRYDEAGEHLDNALELNKTINDVSQQALIFGNLAGLAFKTDRKVDAEEMWRKAVSLAQQDETGLYAALSLSNLGMLLRTEGRLTEAEEVLRQAQEFAIKNQQKKTMAGIHLQLGLLAQTRNDLTQAEKQILLALALDKEAENPKGIAQDLEKLGRIYNQKQMYEQAAREYDRAIYLWAALGDIGKVKTIYELIEENKDRGGRPESMAPYDRLLDYRDNQDESILCQ